MKIGLVFLRNPANKQTN